MKKSSAILSALVFFLVGCADQSGINNPVGATQTSHQSVGSVDGIPTQFTSLPVDEVVIDEKSGAAYAVRGTINCDFFKSDEEYTFTTVASLTVSNEPDGKEYTGNISSNNVDKGPASGDIQISRSYKLPGLPPGSSLSVHFRIVTQPTIEGMSIRVARDESGIETE